VQREIRIQDEDKLQQAVERVGVDNEGEQEKKWG